MTPVYAQIFVKYSIEYIFRESREISENEFELIFDKVFFSLSTFRFRDMPWIWI